MVRLFVAVEVPPAVRDVVAAAVAPVRETMPRLRWVDPARYHLTLVFIGAVDDGRVDDVADAVEVGCAGVAPFELRLDGRLGTFGRRVLWAGLTPSPAVSSLASGVTRAVSRVVALPDADRPYAPHLTLARAGRESVRSAALAGLDVPQAAWRVERAVLLRSAGSYSIERAVALHAADA